MKEGNLFFCTSRRALRITRWSPWTKGTFEGQPLRCSESRTLHHQTNIYNHLQWVVGGEGRGCQWGQIRNITQVFFFFSSLKKFYFLDGKRDLCISQTREDLVTGVFGSKELGGGRVEGGYAFVTTTISYTKALPPLLNAKREIE